MLHEIPFPFGVAAALPVDEHYVVAALFHVVSAGIDGEILAECGYRKVATTGVIVPGRSRAALRAIEDDKRIVLAPPAAKADYAAAVVADQVGGGYRRSWRWLG